MLKLPRVLICSPTSDRHNYCIKRWIKAVDELRYDKDRYAVCIVDTSAKKGKYGEMLRKWGAKVIDHDWDPKKQHPIQMLADAREKYRLEAWKHKFDYILHLDTDVLIPKDGLLKLLKHDKDQAGFVVHAFFTKDGFRRAYGSQIKKYKLKYSGFKSAPAVFKSGKINFLGDGKAFYDYFSWKELKGKGLIRVFSSSIACLLVKKKVYSTIPFRTHPSFVYGEDMWYYAEADEKGFESWCDASVRCRHLNADWQHVYKSKPQLGFQILAGDSFSPMWDEAEKIAKKRGVQMAVTEVGKADRKR